MPVPKRKISKQRKNKRRANDGLKRPNVARNPESGKLERSHTVSTKTGRYKDEEVVKV